MKINLISSPEEIQDLIYTAAKTCTSEHTSKEIFDACFQLDKFKLIRKVIESGHLSVLRHVNFTFTIDGISRACADQLLRHTAGWAFSQQSMRYVKFDFDADFNYTDYYVVPKILNKSQELVYANTCIESITNYEQLICNGLNPEDARGILGLNFKTNVVATCNLQSLIHFCNERLCNKAQSEIQELALQMKLKVEEKELWIGEYLQPKCVKNKGCREAKSCGKY